MIPGMNRQYSNTDIPFFSYRLMPDGRRKFRSQFRQYGQMENRGGKNQRREEKKKEDERRERVRRKKMQVREKVEKLRNIVFFQ
jgi:hypothetical protein